MVVSDPTVQWVMAGWQKKQGTKRFSAKALAKAAKVGHPAVYRIMRGQGTPEQETLDKLGLYFEETAPKVEGKRVLLEGATASEPDSILGWLGVARVSIDRAEAMLRRQEATRRVTSPEKGDELAKKHARLYTAGKAAPLKVAEEAQRPRRAGPGGG